VIVAWMSFQTEWISMIISFSSYTTRLMFAHFFQKAASSAVLSLH
jgi:hypothetical protein